MTFWSQVCSEVVKVSNDCVKIVTRVARSLQPSYNLVILVWDDNGLTQAHLIMAVNHKTGNS